MCCSANKISYSLTNSLNFLQFRRIISPNGNGIVTPTHQPTQRPARSFADVASTKSDSPSTQALLHTEVLNAVSHSTAAHPRGQCYEIEFPAISCPPKPNSSPRHHT
ncbi:unnamed protein product [Hymenolepis diminuta]|uniref:Uncharacterized protein n=1 Tax=Hymenolepis diminuta TaxID=6216 RepID=A0A564YGZ6_HYMDI|nr:unnamed protein product [Hymenolepis diminuta]